MKAVKIIGISFLILLILIFSAIGIALNFIFTPTKITPVITSVLNENMQARVHLEAVELTFFSTFPKFGLKLRNGSLVSLARYIHPADTPIPTDSLLTFRECRVTVNPIAWFLKKEISIHEVRLTDPVIHAFIDSIGQSNWNVINTIKDTTGPSTSGDTLNKQSGLTIDIKKTSIRNGKITFTDGGTGLKVCLQEFNFRLKGSFHQKGSDLDIRCSATHIQCSQLGQVLADDLSMGFDVNFSFNSNLNRLDVNRASMTLNSVDLEVNGSLVEDTSSEIVTVDLNFGLRTATLKEVLKMLPDGIVDQNVPVDASGEFNLEAKVKGIYGKDQIPLITGRILIRDGYVKYGRLPGSIEKLDADIVLLLDVTKNQPSLLDVRKLVVNCGSSQVDIHGRITDLLTNPLVQAGCLAKINFAELNEIFPIAEGVSLEGTLDSHLDAEFRFSDLDRKDYGKLVITGETEINDVKLESIKDTFLLVMHKAHLRLGTESTGTSLPVHRNLFHGIVTMNGMQLHSREELRVSLEAFDLSFTSPEPKETAEIDPVAANAVIRDLVARLGDSLMLKTGRMEAKLNVVPSNVEPSQGIIHGSLSVDSLTAAALTSIVQIDHAAIDLTTQPERTGKEHWSTTGSIVFSSLTAFSPLFPLDVRLDHTELTFSPGEIYLENVSARLGSSNLILTGRLHLPSLSPNRDENLQAHLFLQSDLIDLNELAEALNQGKRYAEEQSKKTQNHSRILSFDSTFTEEPEKEDPEKPTTLSSFIVPANIDLTFETRIRKAIFDELLIDSIRGRIEIKDQSVDLNELTMSNQGATFRTSLLYRAPALNDIYLGLDLDITGIDLGILTDMTPSLDTLLPMLNSLDGKVDFRMAAEANLDTNLSIILKTLHGAASLHADSLVILNSENFTRIAKMLCFKNKQRNLIDEISAEILLTDGVVEVYPFLLQADVYKVAMGGVQNLDQSFNYHVSLLAPLRISMDITGTPGKMKFDLVKSRYRDQFIPSRKGVVDSSSLLIRKKIREELTRN